MAYKFQSGDATLSGSVTLVSYQDLLFEADGTSNIGAAAKEVGVIYTTRQTASVGISGSAIHADYFYGNGSNLTGVPGSETAKVTGSNQNVDLQLVLVQAAGNEETLAVDNAGAIAFNPSTNLLSSTGAIVAGTTLSASTSVSGKSILLGQNGQIGAVGDTDLITLETNKVNVAGALSASSALMVVGKSTFGPAGNAEISAAGAISGSSTLNIVGASNFGPANNLTISAAGVLSGSGKLQSDVGVEFAKNKFVVSTAGALTTLGVDSKLAASDVAIATTDYLYFADANDSDKVKKDAVDDVMKIGMSLLSEAPISLANDFLVYSDQNDSNYGKRIKMKSFIAAAADGTTITSSNGVLSVVGAQNIDVTASLGNASIQLTQAGMHYATASIATNVTYTLPASPANGDIVYIKLAGVNSGKHAVISGSGTQTIDGVSTLTASSPYAGISLCYVKSDTWRVF